MIADIEFCYQRADNAGVIISAFKRGGRRGRSSAQQFRGYMSVSFVFEWLLPSLEGRYGKHLEIFDRDLKTGFPVSHLLHWGKLPPIPSEIASEGVSLSRQGEDPSEIASEGVSLSRQGEDPSPAPIAR